ncbi:MULTISPECIES: flagellar basal-body MS-ring/collar protein FliF [unclassified Dyella]|uniref:flagellar basal-body MS-ring/collar protein FliF n=1 Tax=unclassified Dyella TaxID=2634549 RepID=UPI000C828788|nr:MULTISPECIES: flagellar basal-body MS-ring/collar protein FliF [unclassified Dyella]MDR3445581.1 flagellar basal-body MS-ring/collar protein FliF [Dyella sp.]PMQ06981.1 Flagellar M-ring protein [Dyella sp. AD56]
MADNALATTDEQPGSRLDLKQLVRTPASRQLLLLVGVAAAVALGVAVVLWSRGPNYGLLYAGLEQKDAAAVTQALQASNTPYTLGADGTSIMVPASDLAAIRLKLASQGLPQGSSATTAVPGGDSPFGMSDLAERTRYQQMLETDLGSTIAGLQSVRAARVHLALPKPSAFIRDNKEASASVLVTLYPGRQLDASQVAAIVHLVASSVPNLDPKQVSVVDQQGQLLTTTDAGSASAIGDTRLRLATRIENTYAQRIEELLTPLVGPGKVRAQVYADLDFSETEKATETFDHEHPALRSEQTNSESHVGQANDASVPGALSNQPPNNVAQPTAAKPAAGKGANGKAAATTAQSNAPGDTSSSATRNYELDRTISHVSDPAGRLARLTVAVVLDNKTVAGDKGAPKSVPFTPQELEHLTTLTRNAVGYNERRGDNVSVINQPFHQDPNADMATPTQPFWERPGMLDLIKQAAGILVALLVAFGLLRPLLRGLSRAPTPGRELALAGAGPGAPTISVRVDDEDVGDDLVKLGGVPPQLAYEQRIGLARRMVSENPKQVAQVVKSWVGEDGG